MISELKNFLKNQSSAALGLCFAGLLTPGVALYASKGVIVLFIIASVACLLGLTFQLKWRSTTPKIFALTVLCLAIWAVASLGWTISHDASWPIARSLPFILFGGGILIICVGKLDSASLQSISRATFWGYSLGTVLALIDITTGYAISQVLNIYKYGGEWNAYMPGFVINNGITVLALFLWPACIFLWSNGRYKSAIVGFFVTLAIAGQSSNFAAFIAVIAGAFTFLLYILIPRYFHKIAVVGLSALILCTPFIMKTLPDARTIGEDLPQVSSSVYPRLVIWQYASNLILENPVTGYGIRTSRVLNKEAEPIWFVYRHNGKIGQGNTKAIPLHPHNGIIQLWLELGGVGAAIGLAIVLSILWGVKNSKSPPVTKAFMNAALLSSICLISVSYGLWQSWWMGLLWLQGALILASSKRDAPQAPV